MTQLIKCWINFIFLGKRLKKLAPRIGISRIATFLIHSLSALPYCISNFNMLYHLEKKGILYALLDES